VGREVIMLFPAAWKMDKTVSIEQYGNVSVVKCRVRGGRKLDVLMSQTHPLCGELYIESESGVRPRRLRLFNAFIEEYSHFDKNGMRTLVFSCAGVEKVEMKVPKMWGAA
jgi:hypothetical protein